jgi:glycosyltransferase involved in cell wall biosynthesis
VPPIRHVGLNAIFLQPRMGGLQTYARRLPEALLEVRPELRLSIFVSAAGREVLAAEPWSEHVELVTHPLLGRTYTRAVTELTVLGRIADRHGVDVVHSLGVTGPLRTRATNVLSLADVTWLREPGSVGTVVSRLWRTFVPTVARRADRVITFSETSKREIAQDLRVPERRIDVVPLAASDEPTAEPTAEHELRTRLELGAGPIVLAVSALSVHKNLPPLVEAMPHVRRSFPDAVLVLPGNPSRHQAELESLARAGDVGEAVRFPGWADDADLEGLYAAASCLVFPSLREGFGLPVLEAMRRRVPVACSNASAIPEVAGDAALYFDPRDSNELAEAVCTLLGDRQLAAELASKGYEHQRAFTWRRVAEETLVSYERARS